MSRWEVYTETTHWRTKWILDAWILLWTIKFILWMDWLCVCVIDVSAVAVWQIQDILWHFGHATTASPTPSFRAPGRVDDALVSRGNAGWTTSKSGHTCPCQICLKGPPAEKTGRSLINHPPCPPGWPNQSTDWTELSLCFDLWAKCGSHV